MGKRKRIKRKYEKVITGIPRIDDAMKGGYTKGQILNFSPSNTGYSIFAQNLRKLKDGDVMTFEMSESHALKEMAKTFGKKDGG